MKANFKRRIACLGLTAVMSVSLAAGNALAFAKNGKGADSVSLKYDTVNTEEVTGKVDLTGVALQNLSPSVIQNANGYSTQGGVKTVIVKLKGSSVLEAKPEGEDAYQYISSYAGGRTAKNINASQNSLLKNISDLGISYTEVYRYSTVTNAVALKIDTSYISKIKSLSAVESVYVSETYAYPETTESVLNEVTSNPSNVYATGIYDSSKYTDVYDGSGMTVAILDTGLDYTHEAFDPDEMHDTDADGFFTKQGVADKLAAKDFTAQNVTVDDVYVNKKVPFAYDYADKDADVYPSYSQHGTHVAGIVAGSADSYADKDGNIVKDGNGDPVTFRGVAPNAQLVICKVFTDDFESKDLGGASTEDLIAALEDCVNLNVDVINMSLGTSCGFSSVVIDGDDEGARLNEIYSNIKAAGISLICAASNDYSSGYGSAFGTNLATNPDSGTIGSPSTFDGAMSVGSINGQYAPFMLADKTTPVFFQEASDENQVRYDFLKQLLYDEKTGTYKQTETFKYVIVPGVGRESEYTAQILRELRDKSQGRTIAVITRGSTTFKEKIETLMSVGYETINGERVYTGADAAIVCNNVPGNVGMSLGEIDNPLPAVSVTLDAGNALKYDGTKRKTTGLIELNTTYLAGPFMNDYSSWGTTPDLKLKPDVTAHGGEITSAVAGGYAEMSGTSMATPNLAGFAALLRGKIKDDYNNTLTAQELTRLTNQILMSTAITVYDTEGLPYSPRKQGSGLATIDNAFNTKAYLYTQERQISDDVIYSEDGRPKYELGADKDKNGKYTIEFYVKNTGVDALQFKTNSIFMTESLASDGFAVAEKAHLFNSANYRDHIATVWTVNGVTYGDGDTITVSAGEALRISVALELSDLEKRYLNTTFTNGMFVEGFLKLDSLTNGQCGLTLPFMGFYGDWKAAPMLDYDCYEISEFEQDTSYNDITRPQASIWATQAFGYYYNEKYTIPLGDFLYVQDESADQIYCDPEHVAISRFNLYNGEESNSNYMSTTGIKALYAGLLRNAELVTCDIYDSETGALIGHKDVYRVGKSFSAGGSTTPSQVLLEFYPDDYGLVNNGKYELDFHFYFDAEDANNEEYINSDKYDENAFSMIFYVDYEAPVLVGSRIRYEDHTTGSGSNKKVTQTVNLELDIFDNNYAQSVLLCYAEGEEDGAPKLKLATDYITPVYNANKNGTTTVSIPVTDFYEKYNERLYVQIEDYALNHRVYRVSFSSSATTDSDFEISGPTEITIGVNETYKVELNFEGNTNLSNFVWTATNVTGAEAVKVKNGEIFGAAVGDAVVTVSNANGTDESKKIIVHVIDKGLTIARPSISFGAIESSSGSLIKPASNNNTVKVNAGANFKLEIICDPWYYPVDDLEIVWESVRSDFASVDAEGNVQIFDKKGSAPIKATAYLNGRDISTATVTLNVQDPFTISNYTLTEYHGTGGVVEIPNDKNIMTIGSEAFKDKTGIKKIIIPKTVTQISERAFLNCVDLEEVYFVKDTELEENGVPTSALATILNRAFVGCTNLKKIDFSHCKKLSIDREAFMDCTSLSEIVGLNKVGTLNARAFKGCTALEELDLTGLHISGNEVFANCTLLSSVETGYYTAIGVDMFKGCTALESITINAPAVAAGAFQGSGLKTVEFGDADKKDPVFTIGANAFYMCVNLDTVNFNGYSVSTIGDMAFAECDSLTSIDLPAGLVSFGDRVFENTPVTVNASGNYTNDGGAVYQGTKLILAPKTINSTFAIATGTTEIAPYAFSGCRFSNGVTTVIIPSTVTKIGEGAFAYSEIQTVTFSGVTEIAAHTFAGSSLTKITVPAEITSIGTGAFADCKNLSEVTFAAGSDLKTVGNGAFSGCTSLESISLPDGAAVMGYGVFSGCTSLKQVVLPSVTSLGVGTFIGCNSLTGVTFGENAKTTGDMTFINCANLTNVTLGNETYATGFQTFAGCVSLAEINLNNVTDIGEGAFMLCTSLATVSGLDNVINISAYAFNGCTSLSELNLTNAVVIGTGAFAYVGMQKLTIPKVEVIGELAFIGGQQTSLTLPATLKVLGDGAFANSNRLTAISVDEANGSFISDDGVVYKIIRSAGEEDAYELCVYPSAKYAPFVSQVRQFNIKEGTITIQAYAMARIVEGTVARVILPYSVKTIGAYAFYGSGIGEYRFESINAPVLLTNYYSDAAYGEEDNSPLYLFYTNFGDEFMKHVTILSDGATPATARIFYPTNGLGYDNYVYTNYFGEKTLLGELMDDLTRSVNKMIDAFVSLEEIQSWNSLPVNAENTAMIKAFSDKVIEAHAAYNNIRSEAQLAYLGDNIQKLNDTENALKIVKERFTELKAKVTSMTVSADSTHKTEYYEGEKFNMSGLKLLVEYDDFTTEVADLSRLSLASAYRDGLTTLDRYVVIEGYGVTVRVAVSVTPGGAPEKGGANVGLIVGCVVGGVAVLGAAAAAVVIVLLKKKKQASEIDESGETAATEEVKPEVAKADEVKTEEVAAQPAAEEQKPAKAKKAKTSTAAKAEKPVAATEEATAKPAKPATNKTRKNKTDKKEEE